MLAFLHLLLSFWWRAKFDFLLNECLQVSHWNALPVLSLFGATVQLCRCRFCPLLDLKTFSQYGQVLATSVPSGSFLISFLWALEWRIFNTLSFYMSFCICHIHAGPQCFFSVEGSDCSFALSIVTAFILEVIKSTGEGLTGLFGIFFDERL